jgi:hypothetical protein
MSAEKTPLERATEAVQQRSTWPSIHWGMKKPLHPEAAAAFTTAALTAALSGNGVSDLLYVHAWEDDACRCGWTRDNPDTPGAGDHVDHQDQAIRTYLLGGAS